jgi:hypothetical protein
MTGQATINGVDIDTYGAVFIKPFYEVLLKPAARKDVITNTSRLENGSRNMATIQGTKFKSRDLSLKVMITGSSQSDYLNKIEAFMNAISTGEITLSVSALNRSYNLVYSDCASYGDYGLKKGIFTIRFTEYKPKED